MSSAATSTIVISSTNKRRRIDSCDSRASHMGCCVGAGRHTHTHTSWLKVRTWRQLHEFKHNEHEQVPCATLKLVKSSHRFQDRRGKAACNASIGFNRAASTEPRAMQVRRGARKRTGTRCQVRHAAGASWCGRAPGNIFSLRSARATWGTSLQMSPSL